MYRLFFSLLIILLGVFVKLYAQKTAFQPDTVRLTVSEAEARFVKENLTLLADRYDVDIAKSKILDARLWNNPNLNYAMGLYDPQTKKYFDNSKTGTYAVQIQELFSIAGKHSNTVKLAKINEKITEFQFQDIIRSLKYQLYSDLNTLYIDQNQAKLYDYQIEKLNVLLTSMNQEKQLGVVAGNDVLRLKAEIEDLKNSSIQNFNEMQATEKDLKILLNYPYSTFIIPNESPNYSNTILPALPELITTAASNRPDLLASKTSVDYQNQNIKLQKSLGVPDLTLAVWRDESGSYSNNLEEISLGFDLPLFNRNQHQIKIAKYQFEQSKLRDSLQQNSLENEVAQAFAQFQNINKQFGSLDNDYNSQLDEMNNSAVTNYSKRLINLIDFLDQIRTYTTSKISFMQLKKQYSDAANYLNFVIGTPIIK